MSVTIANWFDSEELIEEYPTKNKPIYKEIMDIADEVVIMNYTTNNEQFYSRVSNELEYADSLNKKVTIALETTNIGDNRISFFSDIKRIKPFLFDKKIVSHQSFKEFSLHDLDSFVASGLQL